MATQTQTVERFVFSNKRRRTVTSSLLAYLQYFPVHVVLVLFLLLFLQTVSCDTADNDNAHAQDDYYLTSDSVVLITGAAGFVGSELAMTLHRTYKPNKIICVDSMDNNFGTNNNTTQEERLALFDVKRQRAFHVLQVLGNHGHFYRADFRPSIPEYFDVGEVPILHYIWRDHPDITHVVHLADAYHRGSSSAANIQAVPRVKQDTKAGMMEALMEQIAKIGDATGKMPHFTYASSYEVYNYFQPTATNPSPFEEERPITTPSSLRGTTKLIDEIITRTYQEKYGIYSIGLRFFSIYGPWGLPGTNLYEMAERAVTEAPILTTTTNSNNLDDVRDYVYIDDAVDAIMAAMQFRTNNLKATVVNVGSGVGTTMREIAAHMDRILSRQTLGGDTTPMQTTPTTAIASMARAKTLLGFQPQVSLRDGLVNLLSWHYDRAFPYGPEKKRLQGISSCSAFDKECLHGAPVFPCASECSHETQCTTSYFDDVTSFTMSLTESCETVMYTVALDNDLEQIPSSKGPLAADKRSHLKGKFCNIAFVSEMSPLVRRLKQKHDYPFFSTVLEEFRRIEETTGKKDVLMHGFWNLVPLPLPSFAVGDEHTLSLLPKLSPGAFFGETTKRAIYCDPNVAFTNVKTLLEEAKKKPLMEGTHGATALLVGYKTKQEKGKLNVNESVQAAAYRMIRIGIIEQMISQPLLLDSSWMVHTLQNEDSRLFRCDVFGEVVQWDTTKDDSSLEFVVGLHDMWARVIEKGQGREPWWIGDSVVTVRESRRRLTEEEKDAEIDKKTGEVRVSTKTKVDQKQKVSTKEEKIAREVKSAEKSEGDVVPAKAFEVELDAGHPVAEVDAAALAEQEGLQMLSELDLENPNALEEDSEEDDTAETRKQQNEESIVRDVSAYATWMGMLSSTTMHYFVRIVPSSELGVVFLNEEPHD
jgi:nucleoside-diphosphate-sugar epimerase